MMFIKSTMFPKSIPPHTPPMGPMGVYFLDCSRHFWSDGHQNILGKDFGHLGVLVEFLVVCLFPAKIRMGSKSKSTNNRIFESK